MRIAVIGGGIQGCSVALEAAERGASITLFERDVDVMRGASLHSEGKIHLGFVYALDDSYGTSRLMATGAAQFEGLLRRWLGPDVDALTRSAEFAYAVHRDSMLEPDELEIRYKTISDLVRSAIPPGSYFGADEPWSVTRWIREDVTATFGDDVVAAFSTNEIAVDPVGVAALMTAAVHAHPAIEVVTGAIVDSVDPLARTVTVEAAESSVSGPFDHVVNCSWADRLRIDVASGFPANGSWSHRMKYFVRATGTNIAPSGLSVTVVQGGFGDFVAYSSDSTYLSWYPVGRRGMSTDLTPPPWPDTLMADEAAQMLAGTLDGLRGIVPDVDHVVDHATAIDVQGGVICAAGDSDIDDGESLLHTRTRSGVQTHDAYHSIDTGKYTTAPLFAVEAVDRISGRSIG